MSNGMYNSFKSGLLKGSFGLDTGGNAIKVALVGSGYTYSATQTLWSGTGVSSNEVTGAGYTTGGATITNSVDGTTTTAKFNTAGDITWSTSTITAYGAIVYDSVTGKLIAYWDFGGAQVSTAGNFTISWAANLLVSIA